MKPAELFPGAVVLDHDGNPVVIESHNLYVMMDCVTPLPLSPAVLRGFGLKDEEGEWLDGQRTFRVTTYRKDWFLCMGRISSEITHANQLQALAMHLYGVELTWNQDEYEQALKEDAK